VRFSSFLTTPLLAASPALGASPLGGIEQWVNIEILQKLVHHTSAVIAAVVMFWFVGLLLRRLLHEGYLKRAVLLLDEFVLFALFAFLAWEILAGLVRRILQGGIVN
jgi:hypothetical protein